MASTQKQLSICRNTKMKLLRCNCAKIWFTINFISDQEQTAQDALEVIAMCEPLFICLLLVEQLLPVFTENQFSKKTIM